MIFLTISGVKGQTYTINPNQITLIMESEQEYWIVLDKHSIQITAEIYADVLKYIQRVTIDIGNPIPKDLKCEDLQLSVRTANCLFNANIIYVHELLEMTQTDLLRKVKNFGRKSLHEIIEKLADKYDAKLKGGV